MWSIPDSKDPGLDGYNSKFYKAAWPVVGNDVVSAIQQFFVIGKLLKVCNTTAITLVPKVPSATVPGDFRPIACVHTLYKCIFKLICSRLSMVLNNLISPNQGAFVAGRIIIQNILLCQDIICHYTRKSWAPSCLVKVDLKKAYDTMDWFFIKDMRIAHGFPHHFMKIVFTCISTASFSLVVNGVPLPRLQAKRGLRQGDPMSPLLFVIGMEYLSRILECASIDPLFKYHPICKLIKLNHLCFADDLMLFSKGNLSSIQIIYKGLEVIAFSSGLCANTSKSAIYLAGVTEQQQRDILTHTSHPLGKLPFKYLGVPLNSISLSVADCEIGR